MASIHCFICGAAVLDIDGPVSSQSYLPQSPGCWKLYTEVLEREYGEWQYPPIHRLTVDCYAAQHPTKEPDQKSAQSVTLHLVGICLEIEKKLDLPEIPARMHKILKRHKGNFLWLEPPKNLGSVTIADVHTAQNLKDHTERVNAWARAVWEAWSDHQKYICALIS